MCGVASQEDVVDSHRRYASARGTEMGNPSWFSEDDFLRGDRVDGLL